MLPDRFWTKIDSSGVAGLGLPPQLKRGMGFSVGEEEPRTPTDYLTRNTSARFLRG